MNNNSYFSFISNCINDLDLENRAPAHKHMLASLQELRPNKKNWFGFAFCIIIGAILSYIVGFSENTVLLAVQTCDIIFGTQLSVFACIFAVYSILLAFLSDSYIKKLLKIDYGKGTSYLKASTKYFESALFIYFIAIILSLVLKLFLTCIPNSYGLVRSEFVNSIIAMGLLFIYYAFSLRVVYELKSIIYNTVLLFRASIAYKILSFSKENGEGKDVEKHERDPIE